MTTKISAYSTLLFILLFSAGITSAFAKDKIIDPHWTGKHCNECHIDGKAPVLKHNADPIKLCLRCHEKEHGSTDIHPVGIRPGEKMQKNIPEGWPLHNNNLSCLTCHEPLIQMHENPGSQKTNPYFLRGKQYESIKDFCFNCHLSNAFKKTNPHEQLDPDNKIIETRCLYCHQTLPNPARAETIGDVTFVSNRTDICLGCHAGKSSQHPAKADHLVDLPADIKPDGLYFPVVQGKIFCGTCHNPHQKGVIKREKAAVGAGSKYFLRSESTYKLCIACHLDKKITAAKKPSPAPDLLRKTPGPMTDHKPWKEKKCKICHTADPENRGTPLPVDLCFREGCHKPVLINNRFIHESSVTQNCYFCHESHTAGFDKLLRVNQEKLCYTCHPMLPDHKDQVRILKQDKNLHPDFNHYLQQADLPDKDACSFCHDPNHRKHIRTLFPGVCSDCHIFLNRKLSIDSNSGSDIHIVNKEKQCSECHNPHASEHHYQLKKPLDTY